MKPQRTQGRGPQCATGTLRAAARLPAFIGFAFACVAAMAQTPAPDAPPPASTPVPAQAGTTAPSEPHGFFDAFGNWMQHGVANAGAGFGAMVGAVGGQATQAAKGAADAARSAAKLPATGITAGRERCNLAPNGAPDCRVAAEALCRARGYVGGSSVDFETLEKCPPGYRVSPAYRVSGRDAPEGICTVEHYVTKALCQ